MGEFDNGKRAILFWPNVHDGMAGSQVPTEPERQSLGATLAVAFAQNLNKAKPRAGATVTFGEQRFTVLQVSPSPHARGITRALLVEAV